MTLYEEAAYRTSHRGFLETCIDGNACKENSADERWVGILPLLTQPSKSILRIFWRKLIDVDLLNQFIRYNFQLKSSNLFFSYV